MSAAAVLVTAALTHLVADPDLAALRLFDMAPDRALFPYAQVEDPVLAAHDGAGVTGRVGTLAITCRDGGERPLRLRLLVSALEARLEDLPAELGEGWRLVGLVLARSRIARVKDGWMARSEWAVRVFRTN